jgi:hypothetical protein
MRPRPNPAGMLIAVPTADITNATKSASANSDDR